LTSPKNYFTDFRLNKLGDIFNAYKEIHTDRPEIKYYLRNSKKYHG
jgi:hypothetical protein